MRKNPLLYSDHAEPQETFEPTPLPEEPRSFFFYIIILANSLLVLFVLGVIWFLFLKSPDLELKSLTDRFLGGSEQPTMIIEPSSSTNTAADTPTSKQTQDEIQQARLKQMREQEELAAERDRLERLQQQLESEKQRADALQNALPIDSGEDEEPVPTSTITITSETATQAEPEDEPTIIPNAAREIPPEPVHTNDTKSQMDEILERLKREQEAKQQ